MTHPHDPLANVGTPRDRHGDDLLITGGRVVLPGADEPVSASVLILNGRIAAIGHPLTAPGGVPRLDADGMWVFPGCIDPHVHFNDPGFTEREDFLHGTQAAASGGVTTIVDMPSTSIPPVTTPEHFRVKYEAVSPRAVVDFGFNGGVSAEVMADHFPDAMRRLAPHIIGFKCYFISVMEAFHHLDHYQFHRVLTESRELGAPVLLHAEDYTYSVGATDRWGETNTPTAFYRGRPEESEIIAIETAAGLARRAGADLHIVHVSTAEGARIVGANPFVTGETCPHYLAFTTDDFERIGSPLKVTPPVKPAGHREALWRAVADGTLSFVTSDHAPAPAEQKHTGSIWNDYAGIPGCGTLFPYLYSEGFRRGRLTLSRLVEATSSRAAWRYGLSHKGALIPGRDGDCVLVDPAGEWTVRGSHLLSRGTVTPFEGMTLRGRVNRTISRGRVVYNDEEGITTAPGWGRLVRRTTLTGPQRARTALQAEGTP